MSSYQKPRWLCLSGPKDQEVRSIGWEGEFVGWVRPGKPPEYIVKLKQRDDGALWFRTAAGEDVIWRAGTWRIMLADH
jgi:hypothetical protein